MHEVLKRLTDCGVERTIGEIVDGKKYHSVKNLIDGHYLKVFDGETSKCDACGREFANKQALGTHLEAHKRAPEIKLPEKPIVKSPVNKPTQRKPYKKGVKK
jgi:hypothetical protein